MNRPLRCFFVAFLSLFFFGLEAQNNTTQDDTITWSVDVEDVVVTAAYAPTHSSNAIHLVRVLKREDIDRLQARNLEQLLVTDINIRIEQDPQLGSSAKLAGLAGQNVKIMVDGVPVVGRLNGNIDLSQIQLYNVERVEIVEGPLAVNYGTDALAGVINIITKKSQLNTYDVQVDAAYEDKGEKSINIGGGMRLNDQWLLRALVGVDRFDGVKKDSSRYSVWKPKTQKYANASLRFSPGRNHDLIYGWKGQEESVLNEGEIQRPHFKPYAFDERYQTRRIDHDLQYKGQWGQKWYLNSFLAHNYYYRQVDQWRRDLDSGENMRIPLNQDTSSIRSWHSRTTFSTRAWKPWMDGMVGMDHRYEDFKGKRIVGPGEDPGFAYILDNAFFGSLQLKLWKEKLKMETGLRYTINNRFSAPLIPSVNVRYELNENWTFRGSFGRGFRSPDIKEMFFSFIDINHFILGNPDLVPETSNNVQGGLTYYRSHRDQEVTLGVHGFYNHIRDKIELYEYIDSGRGPEPAIDTVTNEYTYFNLDEFRSTGLTVRMGYDRRSWRIRASYGLVGYYNVGHEQRPDISPYSYTNEVSVDGSYLIPGIKTDLQMVIRYYDRQIQFFPEEDENGNPAVGKRIQDGYTHLDLFLSKSFDRGRFKLTSGVKNVLDVKSTTIRGETTTVGGHTSSRSSQLVSTGRRWFVGLTYHIGWDQ